MQDLYNTPDYRAALDAYLRTGDGPTGKNRRGISRLAEALKVHPTFIAKTLQGSANFSMEQAIGFCRFAQWSDTDTEFFTDLVAHDRAGDAATKQHFAARLHRHRAKRQDLKARLTSERDLTLEEQTQYYDSWLPQAIHTMCQLPGPHTASTLASALKLDAQAVALTLAQLEQMGFVETKGAGYQSTLNFIHTGKDAPLIRRQHSNWRQKTISDLMTQNGVKGLHFTGVCSLSEAAAAQIHKILVDSLAQSKELIAAAREETVYLLAVDFYSLL